MSAVHTQLAKVREDIETPSFALTNGMPRRVWAKRNAVLVARDAELTAQIGKLAQHSAHAAMISNTKAAMVQDLVKLPARDGSTYRPASAIVKPLDAGRYNSLDGFSTDYDKDSGYIAPITEATGKLAADAERDQLAVART